MQAVLNFYEFFNRLSGCLEKLGKWSPRLKEYEKLFGQSTRIREALSDFYSIVVEFCTKVVCRLQERGSYVLYRNKVTSKTIFGA